MGQLKLKVDIEKNSGFCFGVTKAIRKAEEELDKGNDIYSLGEIVHNEQEITRLSKKGLKTISYSEFEKAHNITVLFRAHGEPPASYHSALLNNNQVIDASCPIILKLQEKIMESYANGENIYIFGKHNHPEIIGLNGKIRNKAVIFEEISELNLDTMPRNITLYSQTTKGLSSFREVVETLKSEGINVIVNDSICRHVSNREDDLFSFSARHDVIVFVSGKNSSNGRQLYQICKEANQSCHFISAVDEIMNEWFSEGESVGICGATSTPLWLIQEARKALERL